MLEIKPEEIIDELILTFPKLVIELILENENYKIFLKNDNGATMYFYPNNILNFQKIYNKIAFESQKEYIEYLVSDIKNFYGEEVLCK